MTEVYNISLVELASSKTLVLTPGSFTIERFRFIDCSAIINQRVLRIIERNCLHDLSYAVVSYIWRGVPTSLSQGSLLVPIPDGDDPGDPISIAVLHTACVAALKLGATFLWLDRLCVMQTSKADKTWQIKQMSGIYQSCKSCFVFPSGLQRLVALDEETSWIYRAWTLQEAMAEATYCVFSWAEGTCNASGLTDGKIVELERGHSAMMDLGRLLQAAFVGLLRWGAALNELPCKVFGSNKDPILALMGAKELKDNDMRETATWRSALMRTSSRPVDMVFSIMGLFGVSLDVGKYGKTDRERATIDLAEAVLKTGRRATWLAASIGAGSLSGMCTMPSFPATAVEGAAFYEVAGQRKQPWEVIGSGLVWAITQRPRE